VSTPVGTWVGALVARLRAAGCVFAEDEARLLLAAGAPPADLETMVRRRLAGEPLEQVLGYAEFCGLRISVEPGVFVPRQRTAFLVTRAASLVGPASVVVDLCCGSGAVGAALLARTPGTALWAVDVDAAAVRCARRNLAHTRAIVLQGDLFDALPADLRGRVDVVVANAPYVPAAALPLLPPEAREHEPRVALDGGTDGLDVHRRIAIRAPSWLAPGGHLVVETSARQAPGTAAAVSAAGLVPQVVSAAELDACVVTGTLPG